MKLKTKCLFEFAALIILLMACDRPVCKNANPVFDNYTPDSREYKVELVKQLQTIDRSKLSFWFNEYHETDGKEQLFFNIQGDGLCAVIVLNVEKWEKLEQLRKTKGVGYRGARFTHLTFDIQQDSVKTEFIYNNFDQIID